MGEAERMRYDSLNGNDMKSIVFLGSLDICELCDFFRPLPNAWPALA